MKHSSLYITGIGPISEKSSVALGVMQMLGSSRKVAIFRPIISDPRAGEEDPCLHLLLRHFKIGIPYEDSFAYTLSAARRLIGEGARDSMLETIIAKYKKLEQQFDFVLCLGTDFLGRDAIFEFDLNIAIASNLGCQLMLVVDGNNLELADILPSMRLAFDALRPACLDVAATVVSRASLSAADLASLRGKFGHDGEPALIYAVPSMEPGDRGEINTALDLFERHVDSGELSARLDAALAERKKAPMMFEFELLELAKSKRMRIVLAEGEEERILRASDILLRREVADLILLGDVDRIRKQAAALGLDISRATLINPLRSPNFEDYVNTYHELRKAKGVTPERAREAMSDATYFATMMVKKDHADGMVSGSINTTAHTIRPAFEFIKTKPGFSVVSSVFLMCLKDRVLVFGDCAVNPNPTAQQLAEIAIASAHTAKALGIEPRVAMLSYSTGTSGKGPDVDIVVEAARIAREMAPEIPLEGPLQYDAAISPTVARTKLPGSKVAGRATVFIFPDLNTGNNTYKAVQRAANAIAIGPVLQGLKKPVNDLSRGCLVPDIVNTVAITAVQAAAGKTAQQPVK